MVSQANTKETLDPEIEDADAGSEEKHLTSERDAGNVVPAPNIGQMIVTLFEGDVLEIRFPNIGKLTPGRVEKASNAIFRAIMLARSAAERGQDPQPVRFNLRDME